MAGNHRVLILGATGMLGHRLGQGLHELGHTVLLGLRTPLERDSPYLNIPVFQDSSKHVVGMDGFDWRSVQSAITAIRPDCVINCIGLVKQRDDGQSAVPCIAINALLPHAIEQAVATYGGRLIHFSTDCVFKGDRGSYGESDQPDAEDWYGRSKAMGEITQSRVALTLRTSIVGPEISSHRSLMDWFVSNWGGEVRGYSKVMYSGVTTREMVRVIDLVLTRHPSLSGLYQIASEPISKYDLLKQFGRALAAPIIVKKDDDEVLDRTLDAGRFHRDTGYKAPGWSAMLDDLAQDYGWYWQNDLSVHPGTSRKTST